MGEVYHSIHQPYALFLRNLFNLKAFIETGTFRGHASAWASKHFDRVYTVEIFENYIKGAKETVCAGLSNIEFYQGYSDEVLPEILEKVHVPALIWLDAHWGGDLHYEKPEVECPLLGELNAISKKKDRKHIIMIDDARLFLDSPSPPLTPEKWATISDIIKILSRMDYYPIISDDVIICVPRGSFGVI